MGKYFLFALRGLKVSGVFLTLAMAGGASADFIYNVRDLGALGGRRSSRGFGINDKGQVTGYSNTSADSHAFLYNGTMTDLGTLVGGTLSTGLGINNSGQITGYAEKGGYYHAILYSNGSMNDLSTLLASPAGSSYGLGINNSGQVTGYAEKGGKYQAFLYSNGAMSDLGTLSGTTSYAFGINDSGQMTGYSEMSGYNHAFLYSNRSVSDLGTLSGDPAGSSFGLGINDSGRVTGYAEKGGKYHAFLYSDGAMSDLGILPGQNDSYGIGINHSGQVVGQSGDKAFMFSNGVLKDLNNLLDNTGQGWNLASARGINDAGQITGYGTIFNGQEHAFLLTPDALSPTPLPASVWSGVALMGGIGLASLNRRKSRHSV